MESTVTRRIEKLLPDAGQWEQRRVIHDAVVRALEGNSSWIETYEATGEIHLPEDASRIDGISEDTFAGVKKVHGVSSKQSPS